MPAFWNCWNLQVKKYVFESTKTEEEGKNANASYSQPEGPGNTSVKSPSKCLPCATYWPAVGEWFTLLSLGQCPFYLSAYIVEILSQDKNIRPPSNIGSWVHTSRRYPKELCWMENHLRGSQHWLIDTALSKWQNDSEENRSVNARG